MLDHRMQILLDERRYRKLADQAKHKNVSIAAVIREAIDRLPDEEVAARRRAAVEAILNAEPMPVPDDPEDLTKEIDTLYDADYDWE